MRSTTLADLSGKQRSVIRPVALAFRRTRRALEAQGMHSRFAQEHALDAANDEYLRLVPEGAALSRPDISALVNPMIAAAVSADAQWFWHGPDA
jgi:hypothetical protein